MVVVQAPFRSMAFAQGHFRSYEVICRELFLITPYGLEIERLGWLRCAQLAETRQLICMQWNGSDLPFFGHQLTFKSGDLRPP